jgi:hypothetical protein
MSIFDGTEIGGGPEAPKSVYSFDVGAVHVPQQLDRYLVHHSSGSHTAEVRSVRCSSGTVSMVTIACVPAFQRFKTLNGPARDT